MKKVFTGKSYAADGEGARLWVTEEGTRRQLAKRGQDYGRRKSRRWKGQATISSGGVMNAGDVAGGVAAEKDSCSKVSPVF